MAAPTQVYPPWLTPVVTVVDDPFGVPFTTFTSVAFLPLTYYGPSIPLGPDWTYGGLVSPTTSADVPPPTLTTLTTAPPTTAIPTVTSTSTTLSSTLSSVISPSTTFLPTSTIPTPTPTATQADDGERALGRGQLIGIIIAGILAFIFLVVVFLCLWLWWKNHRYRSRNSTTRFETVTPLTDDYHMVRGEEGQRAPGEGSPRHSGEERDPFLQPSAGPSRPRQPHVTPVPIPEPRGYPDLAVPEPGSRAGNSVGTGGRNSSGTNSGYGDPLEKPTLDVGPVNPNDPYFRRGNILSTEELQRVDEETYVAPGSLQPSAHMALTPPPVLPRDYAKSRSPQVYFTPRAKLFDGFSKSSPIYEDAHPLPVNESGYLSAVSSGDDYRISWLRGSVANIARFSWFSRLSDSLNPASRHNRRSNDPDIEALLSAPSSPPRMSERQPFLLRNVTPIHPAPSPPTPIPNSSTTAPRPISGVSGQSGTSSGTVYFDAASSLPSTPSLVRPAPAAVSSSARTSPNLWATTPPPPAFDTRPLFVAGSAATGGGRQSPMTSSSAQPSGFDILDMPAPSALAPLVSSRPSRSPPHSNNNPFLSNQDQEMDVTNARQDAETATIFTLSGPPPVKTALKSKTTWGERSTSDVSRSTALEPSFSMSMDGSTIDVLEEEPPLPGEGWRAMASVVSHSYSLEGGSGEGMRRSVFGMPQVHPPSPHSGLAPSSRRAEQSSSSSGSYYGSASSKARSASEALTRSMNYSGSSEGRRARHERMISPALSAFGQYGRGHGLQGSAGSSGTGRSMLMSTSSSLGASFGDRSRESSGSGRSGRGSGISPPPPLPPIPAAAYRPGRRDGTFGSGSESESDYGGVERMGTGSRVMSPISPSLQLHASPWAGGLDEDWSPSSP